MASPSERRRNDMKVGVFVTLIIIMALFVSVNLTDISGALFASPNTYRVTYLVEDGVDSLQPGSAVRVGGLAMGSVESVALSTVTGDDGQIRPTIDVAFALDERVELYPNPRIIVETALVGSESSLQIEDLGNRQMGDPLPSGAIIVGTASNLLADLLGADPAAMMGDVGGILDDAGAAMADFKTGAEDFPPLMREARAAMEDVRNVATNVDEMVAQVRADHWGTWLAQADEIVAGVERTVQKAEVGVDEAQGALVTMGEILDENRPGVRSTIEDVQAVAATVRSETMTKVHALLDRSQDAVETTNGTLASLRDDYDDWSPKVEEALGNASLAAQQLRLTMNEVRRSPWKVLYQPSPDELDHELLYGAARSFAVATGELKVTAETVQRILDRHGDRLADEPELRERLTKDLLDQLDAYQGAQERLMATLFSSE